MLHDPKFRRLKTPVKMVYTPADHCGFGHPNFGIKDNAAPIRAQGGWVKLPCFEMFARLYQGCGNPLVVVDALQPLGDASLSSLDGAKVECLAKMIAVRHTDYLVHLK